MTGRQADLKRTAAEQAVIKDKRAKGETDLSENLKWEYHGDVDLLTLTSASLPGSVKAAWFDIDFTVIKTASGRKSGASDWEWWDVCVPNKLRELHKDGYRVIFFTNQGIEELKVTQELQRKIEDIIKLLDIPVLAFICTGENHYRKPSTTMWEFWESKCNQGVKVDRSKCLYIGAAAGRGELGKPKDFSCSDRKFASNLAVDFKTPEEYFLGESPAKFADKEYHSKSSEMVIMVGAPATGKSTFSKRYLEAHGYVAVNRDTLKTMQKCVKAATDALKAGKSVVVDNTNPSSAARQVFIVCANNSGVPCRCFVMDTPIELAHHLNYFRHNQTKGGVGRIPDVAYDMYKQNFQAPTEAEGFTEILQVPFVPKFDNKKDEELFMQWM